MEDDTERSEGRVEWKNVCQIELARDRLWLAVVNMVPKPLVYIKCSGFLDQMSDRPQEGSCSVM